MSDQPKGKPISPEAMADIRDEVREDGHGKFSRLNRQVLVLMLRDLLDHADWLAAKLADAETWLARCATDSGQWEAGREAGRAEVLAHVRAEAAAEEERAGRAAGYGLPDAANDHASRSAALGVAAESFAPPAALPPHEMTLARLRRYEEALRAILHVTPIANLDYGERLAECQGIAKDALDEGREP